MSRVPKAETQATHETNLPATAPTGGALASIDLTKAFAATSSQDRTQWLPNLKVAYPIEIGARGITSGDVYRMGITDQVTFKALAVPFVVVALANRNATRKPIPSADGTNYSMAFAECMGMGESQVKFAQMSKDIAIEAAANLDFKLRTKLGVRWLVAVFVGADVAFATVDAFGAAEKYFGTPLTQARFTEKRGVKFTCQDHSMNLTASKADKSHQYLDPKKHNQWEAVNLTPAQLAGILTAWESEKSKVEAWLKA